MPFNLVTAAFLSIGGSEGNNSKTHETVVFVGDTTDKNTSEGREPMNRYEPFMTTTGSCEHTL